MEIRIRNTVLSLVRGDITAEAAEAIVNAANSTLAGGGGVDGAIHRAGGPGIMEECRKIGICPTGSAVITTGGKLKARYVIHAVGPVYKDGGHDEANQLENAYVSSLQLAEDNGIKSVSFPSISTGAYGYPLEDASETALKAVMDFIRSHDSFTAVRFVLFSEKALSIYAETLERLTK
ncbi:MAG: O-acetyl-ADP-ribose deacetylase [Deltaproteobacteria bacterium]